MSGKGSPPGPAGCVVGVGGCGSGVGIGRNVGVGTLEFARTGIQIGITVGATVAAGRTAAVGRSAGVNAAPADCRAPEHAESTGITSISNPERVASRGESDFMVRSFCESDGRL